MNINDYLIAQPGKDWRRYLRDWVPPLPEDFTLWLVNRFGNVIVVCADQSIARLDVGTGSFEQTARSREHFAQLLDVGRNADEWLMISLTDACRRAGMTLTSTQCYGFKVPPQLGGRYEVANIVPTELDVHYSYQAYMYRQTDVYWLPNG